MEKEKLEDRFDDMECVFHIIKKDNIAYHINTIYSEALENSCQGCDGYNFKCIHYMHRDSYSMLDDSD